jgi:hypothetical protein
MFPAAANKTTIQKMNAARHLQVLMTYPNEKIAQQVRSACALCRNLNQPNPTLGIYCEGSTGAAQFGRRLREMTPAALLCAHPLSLRVSVSVSYLVFILVAAIRYIHTFGATVLFIYNISPRVYHLNSARPSMAMGNMDTLTSS